MKNKILFILLGLTAMSFFSCKKDAPADFITTELGYSFKHCTINQNTPKAKVDDILYGEMQIKLNDSTILYSNFGNPERLFKIIDSKKGSMEEFLLNLHIGDSAIMIMPSDSVAQYVEGIDSKPKDKLYFYLKVHQIISKKEIDTHKKEQMERKEKEYEAIDEYIAKKSLKANKQESGLYYINILEGKGKTPHFGDIVRVNYIVSTLEGKIVDTNLKPIAQNSKIYSASRNYEPFEFSLGDDGVIAGWTEGVSMMKEGGKARLIIPSHLAYGENAYGPIEPNSILIFEITLLSINNK